MMAILSVIIILTRILFMENYLETLIFYDSYKFIANAIFTDPSSTFQGSFVSLISLIYPSDMGHNDAINFLRRIMIVFSIQLVLFFYLITRNFFSPFFAFAGAFFVSFLPIFLLYSTTLHNDIFSLAMAFTSLYFTIRFKNLKGLTIASIFVIVAATTRIESALFVLPILISFSRYLHKKIGIRFYILLSTLLISFFGIGLLVGQEIGKRFYYQNQFATPIEQLMSYLTLKNIIMVFNSIFHISENEMINYLFLVIVSVGVIFILILNRRKISKIFSKNREMNDKTIAAIYLIIIFGFNFIFLVGFHIGWNYDEDGNIVQNEFILPRYLLYCRILVTIPFVFLVMMFTSQAARSANSVFNNIRSVI